MLLHDDDRSDLVLFEGADQEIDASLNRAVDHDDEGKG